MLQPPPSHSFDLLAAIDLRGGNVVRLREGDFARETVYGDDPVAVARGLVERGARWLHVVDLDAARTGVQSHEREIIALIDAVMALARIEVAGGIRDAESAARALESGASRVVVGTAALRDTGLVGRLVATHGQERIVVALDLRDGVTMADGWGASGRLTAEQALARSTEEGARIFEVTAIDRDGSLRGPDLELLARLATANPAARIVASGGIRGVADVQAVHDAGCAGAIVGRALYEGAFDLAEAVRLTS